LFSTKCAFGWVRGIVPLVADSEYEGLVVTLPIHDLTSHLSFVGYILMFYVQLSNVEAAGKNSMAPRASSQSKGDAEERWGKVVCYGYCLPFRLIIDVSIERMFDCSSDG